MITIFDLIAAIAFTKQTVDIDDLDPSISMYMVQRWLTMIDPALAVILNASVNINYAALSTNPHLWVPLMQRVVPKLKRQRINYIKKPKKVDKHEEPIRDDAIAFVANVLRESKRNARYMLEQSAELAMHANAQVSQYKKTESKE